MLASSGKPVLTLRQCHFSGWTTPFSGWTMQSGNTIHHSRLRNLPDGEWTPWPARSRSDTGEMRDRYRISYICLLVISQPISLRSQGWILSTEILHKHPPEPPLLAWSVALSIPPIEIPGSSPGLIAIYIYRVDPHTCKLNGGTSPGYSPLQDTVPTAPQ